MRLGNGSFKLLGTETIVILGKNESRMYMHSFLI